MDVVVVVVFLSQADDFLVVTMTATITLVEHEIANKGN